MHKASLLRAIPAGLAPIQKDIERLAQDAIQLTSTPADEAQLAPGISKLGGAPDLPPGTAWPIWKNAPMSFIAQIRLSDVRPFDPEHRLPGSGLLSFFYDSQQQTYGNDPADRGGWQVLYSAEKQSQLERAALPDALPAAARFTPCALAFSRSVTLPQRPEAVLPQLEWAGDTRQQYDDFLATLQAPGAQAGPRHQLLGHPNTLQDDMHLQCALVANGVSDASSPRAAALVASAPAWQLLLQVDSDEHAGMRWGSSGMLYYWIEQKAMRQADTSNIWLVLQSD